MAKKKKQAAPKTIEGQLKSIGNRIKELRKQKGYTNYEFFAYEHGISRSQYGKYEQGADMQVSSLLRILEMHHISLKEFFSQGFE